MSSEEIRTGLLLTAPLLLQLIGLTFAVMVDPYVRRHRNLMLVIAAVILTQIAQNLVGYFLDRLATHSYARTVVGIYGYSVRPVVIVLLSYLVGKRENDSFAWLLIGLNAAVHLTALFSGVCFRIDENNVFHRGPLGYTCHIISAILLIRLVWLTLREYRRVRHSETWIPILNALIIFVSVLFDSLVDYRTYPVTYLTVATVSCTVFYYIWLHLQFVREHERALLAEQRIQIMMTQIQPHFLYNTLSTIQALCRIDPQRAFDVTEKFGTYLRQNIDSLSQPELIPVMKEMEHTRIYAEIEEIRFPNIRVEYDVGDDGFSVPALTVQPLVENAIRHGVRIRENGLVTVTTRRRDGFHEIVIRDNGKGFVTADADRQQGTHIGIRNVRERLEKMCGGTLILESVPDKGTTVTMRIPL